jgi:hypothetical protein
MGITLLHTDNHGRLSRPVVGERYVCLGPHELAVKVRHRVVVYVHTVFVR